MTTAPKAQAELTLDSFEIDLIPGSIKGLMASIKAEYITSVAKEEIQIFILIHIKPNTCIRAPGMINSIGSAYFFKLKIAEIDV